MSTPITCSTANDEFIQFSQLLPSFVSKEIQGDDFYIKNIVKAEFQDGAGRTYTYPIFGRGVVAGDSFAPFTPLPQTGDTCNVPTQTVQFGAKNGSTTPRQTAQQTELFCLKNLQYDWHIDQQLENTVKQMSYISKFTWSQELQGQYIALSGHKVIVEPDFTTSHGPTFPAITPTSTLTWGVLEYVYQKLILRYGGKGAAGFDPDHRPIFSLVGDTNTFQNLKLADANMRDDIRWAYSTHKAEGDPLLSTPGIQQNIAFRGWKFNTVDFPARYNFVSGQYVQVFPYITVPGSNNDFVWDVSEFYEDAAYTVTVAFLDTVLKHLVVKPSDLPSGYKYNALQNWAGTFTWKMEAITAACNPDGDKGFWRGVFTWAPKPERTDDLSYVLMHKRCAPANDLYDCPAPGPVTSGYPNNY